MNIDYGDTHIKTLVSSHRDCEHMREKYVTAADQYGTKLYCYEVPDNIDDFMSWAFEAFEVGEEKVCCVTVPAGDDYNWTPFIIEENPNTGSMEVHKG